MKYNTFINLPQKVGIAMSILAFYACTNETETLYDQNIYTHDVEVSIYENPEANEVLASLTSLDTDPEADPVFSIDSQTVSGLRIEGTNLIVDDPSVFDYELNPVITGEIKATLGEGEYVSDFTINLINRIESDEAFVTTWETTSADETITIYTHANEENEVYYDFDVDWGDGSVSEGATDDIEHIYTTPGLHTVTITGKKFPGITQENTTNAAKLKSVEAWGSNEWTDLSYGFRNSKDLVINATDTPTFGEEAYIGGLFYDITDFNSDISNWDTHNVVNIANIFRGAKAFNQDISGWDVSNVVGMHAVFLGAESFNQPIGSWDMSSAENLSNMFNGANAFNQDLSAWDTSSATNMSAIFRSNTGFNGDISTWDVSNVVNMERAFNGATAFNGDLSNWDTSSLQNPKYLFAGATVFNSDISEWNTSSFINCISMFNGARAFDQPIGSWDMSNVVNITGMFANADSFNQDLSTWDVSAVVDMNSLFYKALSFNQPIGSWDTSSVTNMTRLFRQATAFNQDISSWDTSSAINMSEMFRQATTFNQDLTSWDVSNVTNNTNIFNTASAFDAANAPNWIN